MKSAIIIQARYSSTRLPGKVLLPLKGGSVLGSVIERCKKTRHQVIVATSICEDDNQIEQEALKYGALVYRGSLNDVLERYIGAIKQYNVEKYFVRITSDCPFIDPAIIEGASDLFEKSGADYVSNVEKRTFPHGMDVEVCSCDALFKTDEEEKDIKIREHVTYHIRLSNNYKKLDYVTEDAHQDIRITLDTEDDYTALQAAYDLLPENFTWKDVNELYTSKPWLSRINGNVYHKFVITNEQEEMQEAIKLLKLHGMHRAEAIIHNALAQKESNEHR